MALRENDLAFVHAYNRDLKLVKEKRISIPEMDAETEALLKRKTPLYTLYQYSDQELVGVTQRVLNEARAINGLPRHHSEVLKEEKKGWLLPFLLGYDALYTGRWDYWFEIIEKGTIDGSGPIPQTKWVERQHEHIHQVKKMLSDCINGVSHTGATIMDFADWLLWGFSATEEPPKISAEVNEHFYRMFDLALVLKYPTDYLSGLLEEASSKGHKSAIGYFSTPIDVTVMMAEISMAGTDPEVMKYQSVLDPCVGCGAMLLPASNYTLFGAGQDINSVATKLCKVQMYWYAPWYAFNPFMKDKMK